MLNEDIVFFNQRLPDGVGTNGFVAEVPRFPLNELSQDNVGTMWQTMSNCANV